MRSRYSGRISVRWPSSSGPLALRGEQDRSRAVREDRIRHRGLGLVVQVVGGRAELDGHGEDAALREGPEVVPRLLEDDHRARAAGISHVNALHVAPETERADQVRVEARHEPPGARRGHEVVHVGHSSPALARQASTASTPRRTLPSAKRADSSSIVSTSAAPRGACRRGGCRCRC